MRRHYTGEQRTELVDLVTVGRATIREAAARLGVATSTASYWVRQAAEPVAAQPVAARKTRRVVVPAKARAVQAPRFAQLVRAGDASAAVVMVRVGRVEIAVRRGFDAPLLQAVVEALTGGAA